MPVYSTKITTGVYGIKNIINGKIYVGSAAKSLASRIRMHRQQLIGNRHGNSHLQSAWNKYGKCSFRFIIIEKCVPDLCVTREQHWIDYYNSSDRKFGYNKSPTAGSPLGVRHSEEVKQRMSEAQIKNYLEHPEIKKKIGEASKGRLQPLEARRRTAEANKIHWQSKERRRKFSEKMKGRKHSEEHTRKISEALTGRKLSEEHKAKVRVANLGKKQSTETIAKRAAKLRGIKRSPETVAKIIAANKGRKCTEEQKRKMGIAQRKRFENPEERLKISLKKIGTPSHMKGKHHTEETKKKLRDAANEQWKKIRSGELAWHP